MKRLLIIINPKAGTKQAERYLADICSVFCEAGYETIVAVTQERGDGTTIARERAKDADVVVAVGGDGTFNEVVAGVLESGEDRVIGYIPAGTTNDFAAGLGLSTNLVEAARDIVDGIPMELDIGSFNGRYFSYVASFGAFTNTSYEVPQSLKNMFGHMAYILQGATDILKIKSFRVEIKNEEGVYGGNYIFGAICNSTSMGGVLSLSPDMVDMNDGKFEVLLIRMPTNLMELNRIVMAIAQQKYDDCPLISFFSSSHLDIFTDGEMPWTLDGEYQEGCRDIVIENKHRAIRILTPKSKKTAAAGAAAEGSEGAAESAAEGTAAVQDTTATAGSGMTGVADEVTGDGATEA